MMVDQIHNILTMQGRARSSKTIGVTIKKDLDLKWSIYKLNFFKSFKRVLSMC